EEIRAGAQSAGRSMNDVTVAGWLTVYVTQDYEAGLQRAREWLSTMLAIPRQGELLLEGAGLETSMLPRIRALVSAYPHAGDAIQAARHVPPDVADQLAIIGTPERVQVRLEAYREAGLQVPVLGLTALRA